MKTTVGLGSSGAERSARTSPTVCTGSAMQSNAGAAFVTSFAPSRSPIRSKSARTRSTAPLHAGRPFGRRRSAGRLVIEVIGGTSEAAELVERALERGRHVVTANKDLIGEQGPRLRRLRRRAAPRCDSKRRSAARFRSCGRSVRRLQATKSSVSPASSTAPARRFSPRWSAAPRSTQALAQAQRCGYAEADPSNDVDGIDAAHKLAIVAQLAFGLSVVSPRIRRTRHRRSDAARRRASAVLGYADSAGRGSSAYAAGILADVAPVLVPQEHEFARTAGAENVVQVLARDAGGSSLRGTGAGGVATASAVLGDVVSVLRALGEDATSTLAGVRTRSRPAIDVDPFFSRFARAAELPGYPVWDDELANLPSQPW